VVLQINRDLHDLTPEHDPTQRLQPPVRGHICAFYSVAFYSAFLECLRRGLTYQWSCLPINSLQVACSAISITSLLSTMHKSFRCSVKNYFVCIAVTGYRSPSHTVKHVLRGTIIAILINSLMPTVAIWVVGTATKLSVSDRVTSSVIFDIQAL